ncbi:hypothetical protein [Marinobacterium litorale]|uniref:hypothetical protein n=1 Tax=Marinobacterium litorale TaxID=404770 RepID=UPI001B7FDBB3|nr:hypothetical protein [Marinobacterium litorale]
MSNQVKSKVPVIVFIVGVLLFVVSPKLSVVFAVTGAITLAVSQIRFMFKNEGIIGLVVPTKSMFKEMSSSEALPFKVGAAMLLSPLLAVIVKTLVLHANS